ncbi:T-cell immunomodulatory protein [Xiphophorus maculatus]|uniref:Integrin alpha FG-GAP repeat containing 1 n=1 Tax=Xiphophorus maculatus TaxID=8083 RepID=A0A3B5PVY0_XIPMA|nr:T-cell immunomodulatory protein [Xiphophorus maculatus]
MLWSCTCSRMRMFTLKTFLITFLLLLLEQRGIFALQDVTVELFGTNMYGTVAAFGDFNSDKQTDIFVIREQSEVVIFLADSKSPYFKPKVNITKDMLPGDKTITSVVPGDYDGDSQMDVLLTTQDKSSETSVFIFWGNNHTLEISKRYTLNFTLTDQPLVMDFNGDMIPDVFGVTTPPQTVVCYLTKRIQECRNDFNKSIRMRTPHSNAFIDLDKDFTADLFLTTEDGNFETWLNKDGTFAKGEVVSSPAKTIGQSSFVDFDGDGYQDHLLPACLDEACQKSVIYIAKRSSEEWVEVLSDFKQRDTVWGFVPGDAIHPLVLHLGDYNLDGFPDALVILRNTSGSEQRAFLLENAPCNAPNCSSVGRMFRIHWDQTDLGAIQKAVMATFFDIYEDGILDMLILSEAEGKSDLMIHALKNNFEADAYFVKVMVLSGLCSNACPDDVKPFGVNQPGPYVMYTTADSNGYLKNASAGQLSQSAHFSLQLPYTVLGLGRSANFLDHLFVGIPRRPGETETRKHEWTAIIPNSQLIVIPFPHNTPRRWSAKLYLTPSNSVLLTAIALIGVCVFILVIIGILHWKEKKADDREKRQEAHRFHFDAM